jgi:hypothetical protein
LARCQSPITATKLVRLLDRQGERGIQGVSDMLGARPRMVPTGCLDLVLATVCMNHRRASTTAHSARCASAWSISDRSVARFRRAARTAARQFARSCCVIGRAENSCCSRRSRTRRSSSAIRCRLSSLGNSSALPLPLRTRLRNVRTVSRPRNSPRTTC